MRYGSVAPASSGHVIGEEEYNASSVLTRSINALLLLAGTVVT